MASRKLCKYVTLIRCLIFLDMIQVNGWTLKSLPTKLSRVDREPLNGMLPKHRYTRNRDRPFGRELEFNCLLHIRKSSFSSEEENERHTKDDNVDMNFRSIDELESSSLSIQRKIGSNHTNRDTEAKWNSDESLSPTKSSFEESRKNRQQRLEDVVRKKIRVARAQAEIDRILTAPDAPCDLDGEWAKVITVSPTLSDDPITPDKDLNLVIDSNSFDGNANKKDTISTSLSKLNVTDDTTLSIPPDTLSSGTIAQQQVQHETLCKDLESELYSAIKTNDFGTALIKRQTLDRLQMDHANAVLQINAEFYKAFSSKDYKAMASLWIPDSSATCILPTFKRPLVGNRAVLRSWETLFGSKNVNTAFQRNWVEPSNIHLATVGSSSMAIVTCNENVYVRRFIRGEKRQTIQVNTFQATNVYRKVAGIWYLQYHHASPISTAVGAKVGQGNGNSISSAKRRSVLYEKNMYDEYDSNDEDDNDEDNSQIGMDGILGIQNFGADIGINGKKQQSSTQPQSNRIIMGGLSDLLSGNLGDLLSGSSNEVKGNSKNINEQGYAIIRVSRMEEDDEELDEEEDEDEDDDEDVDVDEDDEDDVLEELQEQLASALENDTRKNEKSVSIIKKWADTEAKNIHMRKKEQEESSKKIDVLAASKEELMRLKCVAALRDLTQKGLLSPSHKRVLLTDIITSSVSTEIKGDTAKIVAPRKSMVQVAYELLLDPSNPASLSPSSTDMNDKDDNKRSEQDEEWRKIAEEEFAEQCRVFAERLM